jgi:hypothetical protein
MSINGKEEKTPSSNSDSGSTKNKGEGSSKSGTADTSQKPMQVVKLAKKDEANFFNLFVLTGYIISDMKKKPRSYKIGIFTVTLTITFVILLYSILDILPLVFLKQAQNTVGESDFVYTAFPTLNITQSGDKFMYDETQYSTRAPPQNNSQPFINATQLLNLTQGAKDFEGFSPRWMLVTDLANPKKTGTTAPGLVMILDTQKEVKIGLGRDFTKTILGQGQAFVTASILKYLGIEPNGIDEIQMVLDTRDYLRMFYGTNKTLTKYDIQLLSDRLNLGLKADQTIPIRITDTVNTKQISGNA